MKNSLKISAVVAAIAALGTSALAQSPAGAWKGHIEMKMPVMPQMTPEQKAQMAKGMDMLKKMVIVLDLKANKTFSLTAKGGPAGSADKPQTGTWSLAGKTLTLKPTPKPGASPMQNQPQTMTLSPNGKTLTMVPPTGGGGSMKIIFNR